MTRSYRLSRRAEAELDEVLQYLLDQSGPERAWALLQRFNEAFEKLADMPGMGHAHVAIPGTPLRVWAVFSYLVFYRPDTSPLEIVRVLHGSRDLPPLFDQEQS